MILLKRRPSAGLHPQTPDLRSGLHRAGPGERGYAMVLSFWMLVVLLMMALAHGYWMYQEIPLTATYIDDIRARALAQSALNIAAGALLADIVGGGADLGLVATEAMLFGKNRADIRINEIQEGASGRVAVYNNSDFPQDIYGWKVVNITNGDSCVWSNPLWNGPTAVVRPFSETSTFRAIDIAVPATLVLVTDAGDTIDTVNIRVGSGGGSRSWQALPDGSNGEFWTTWPRPAGTVPQLDDTAVGWVRLNQSFDTPNGHGEWILPHSVIWNRVTNDSYIFQWRAGRPGAGSDTIAYYVPVDSYFLITRGWAKPAQFSDSFNLGPGRDHDNPPPADRGKGGRLPSIDSFVYQETGYPFLRFHQGVTNRTMAFHVAYDDSAHLAYSTDSPTASDSFLFPLEMGRFPDPHLDLWFFRPRGFAYRFHTDTTPIMGPTVRQADLSGGPNPGGLVWNTRNEAHLYGRITSRMSPYWQVFMHENGDTRRIGDFHSRATKPIVTYSGFEADKFRPDTYWNWLVPGDSRTLIRRGSLPSAWKPTHWGAWSGDGWETWAAFSPFDNHADSGTDPDSRAWWAESRPNKPPLRLDPYFDIYGSLADWDTYLYQSYGLNISEVYQAPTDTHDFVELYNSGYDTRPTSAYYKDTLVVVTPWTGSRYGGGITVRDQAYEYIEIHNTSDVAREAAGLVFEVRDPDTGALLGSVRYVRKWRASDPDSITQIPPRGCAVILPVGADTHVVKVPASAVLLGLSRTNGGVATDTELGWNQPLRNRGDYFTIQSATGTTWHLNFSGRTIRHGRPWEKADPFVADATAGPGTVSSNWVELSSGSPGVCPGDVDHLLEQWATLTRDKTTGDKPFRQFGVDPMGYIRIWAYDESGRLALNQGSGEQAFLGAASGAGAFATSPYTTAGTGTNDIHDTYVTPMDLFYLEAASGSGNPVTAARLKNFTVYADTVINVNTADQYARRNAASPYTPMADDVRVLRSAIRYVTGSTTNDLTWARDIIEHRQGPDLLDSTNDDNICLADANLEAYFTAAGIPATTAATLANSGRFTVRSAGYFTVVGEARFFNPSGDRVGSRTFWSVFERSWTGRTSPTAPSRQGSWRYWRDNWHDTYVRVSNEGSFLTQ